MKHTILVIALILATLVIAAPALAAAPPDPSQFQVPDGYTVQYVDVMPSGQMGNLLLIVPHQTAPEEDAQARDMLAAEAGKAGYSLTVWMCTLVSVDETTAVPFCWDPMVVLPAQQVTPPKKVIPAKST